jgi:hypothetical protein
MSIIGVALARNAETARKVILSFQCESTAAVGDLVYIDPSTANKVLSNTDNTLVNQTIGVIDSKPQATICEVMVLGIKAGYSSLTVGSRVFLSSTGGVTQTKPIAGYLHNLGVAVSSTEVLFIPNNLRTKLI